MPWGSTLLALARYNHKAQAQCTKIGSNLGLAVRSCRDIESWLTEGMLALS